MSSRLPLLFFLVMGISGCATGTARISAGATLLSGLSQYQGDMQRMGGSTERWPDRQRAADTLKTIITATVGASPEFYRLVDLDVKKREFILTLRKTSVRPDRSREMNEELAQMNEEIAALKPVIRTQLAAIRMQSDPEERVEGAALHGLLSLTLDGFSSNGVRAGVEARSTRVGRFVVTDLGGFAAVRAPDGQTFHCILFGVAEEGAGIKCDPTH